MITAAGEMLRQAQHDVLDDFCNFLVAGAGEMLRQAQHDVLDDFCNFLLTGAGEMLRQAQYDVLDDFRKLLIARTLASSIVDGLVYLKPQILINVSLWN